MVSSPAPPPPLSSIHTLLLTSPGEEMGSSPKFCACNTIDPFGSLRTTSENSSEKTPRTPIDPLYLHPASHSPAEVASSPISIGLERISRPPLSDVPSKIFCSQVGSQVQERKDSQTLTGNNGIKSHPLISPTTTTAHSSADEDSKRKNRDHHAPFKLPNVVTTTNLDFNKPHPTSPTADEGLVTDDATEDHDETKGSNARHDDPSSDANNVICEPGGFMWLLSRTFQFVVSVFQSPPLQIEFLPVEQDDGGGGSKLEDLTEDNDDCDNDSQDSTFDSVPSSPQTPVCYRGTSWPSLLVTPKSSSSLPPPPPSRTSRFQPPCSRYPPRVAHPAHVMLPPNWLPWRPRYVDDDQYPPPPPLPSLSPPTDNGPCEPPRHCSFPLLPPRPLPNSQYRCFAATLQAEWIAPSTPSISQVPGMLLPNRQSAGQRMAAPLLQSSRAPSIEAQSRTTALVCPSICCPISGGIMLEPVIDPDGFSYEKYAILGWLVNHTTSPITDRPLASHQLRPNRTLQRVIQSLLQNNSGT